MSISLFANGLFANAINYLGLSFWLFQMSNSYLWIIKLLFKYYYSIY